jgi:hypothetical protein
MDGSATATASPTYAPEPGVQGREPGAQTATMTPSRTQNPTPEGPLASATRDAGISGQQETVTPHRTPLAPEATSLARPTLHGTPTASPRAGSQQPRATSGAQASPEPPEASPVPPATPSHSPEPGGGQNGNGNGQGNGGQGGSPGHQ